MFKRVHHERIARQLASFNRSLLESAHCYFGGGTAIALQLGEYRESRDIDFLCSSREGFRLLREQVTQHTLGDLLTTPAQYGRGVRSDRDKISTFLVVDGEPIKAEFVLEGNLDIQGADVPGLPVPVVSREDLFAEKLLANADRGLDKSTMSRDLIDLAMMEDGWGPLPAAAWSKATAAYGKQIRHSLETTSHLIGDRSYLAACLKQMRMDPALLDRIPVQIVKLRGEAAVLERTSNAPEFLPRAAPDPKP